MGLDLYSIPVRLDSDPVRLMRRDARAWEVANDHPPFSDPGDGPDGPPPAISCALMAGRPDGYGWHAHFEDRSYQRAEYLLDPVGYRALHGWAARERSLPYRIINGDEPFAAYAVGVQGVPWRCSAAAFLLEAADAIDAIEPARARAGFSVAGMATQGLYKTFPEMDEDVAFRRVLENLREFSGYCRRIAGQGYDLILKTD